jgi:hypothetical protein
VALHSRNPSECSQLEAALTRYDRLLVLKSSSWGCLSAVLVTWIALLF